MTQAAEALGLRPEPPDRVERRGNAGPDALQGDLAVQPDLDCPVDHSLPPAAQYSEDAVAEHELGPGVRRSVGRVRGGERSRPLPGLVVSRFRLVPVLPERPLDRLLVLGETSQVVGTREEFTGAPPIVQLDRQEFCEKVRAADRSGRQDALDVRRRPFPVGLELHALPVDPFSEDTVGHL